MPELPEVEMVARDLRRILTGRTIERARLVRAGLAPQNSQASFARGLKGASVLGVERRGKHLLTHVSGGKTLITHLRMTGQFIEVASDAVEPVHTHAIFWLDGGNRLLFVDQRHFGRMRLIRTSELAEVEQLRDLAPEPLLDEFTPSYLYGVIKRSARPVKAILLDQTRVVGLGNIYAAEALFRARINPKLMGTKLTKPRVELLHAEIIAVLRQAIDGGSRPYTENDPRWLVYDREGEPCRVCGREIKRMVQSGRSTYYCGICQKR